MATRARCPVDIADLLAAGPVVVSFYRGSWCPYRNLELRALQARLPELTRLGARLVAISPELPDRSLSPQERHDLAGRGPGRGTRDRRERMNHLSGA
ncbi:hypothetical protein SSPO_081000 [Streptomyces antimycoticus]|uniref:Alkyl hydroperoxide reductase subunit C/ Thiol specific antioxidant domain-containing protein n=1 Tax=Streptomyces antimycoticus TaxID=68175 RepID=A0A499UW38_9ACTN|nr:redoxin domain-containing protein [Streptomyces antimycoticus]BBJ45382.1 hypothetical protein SSPO_081000 [Streptomyces antimycoticus]